ncbi:transposase [Micromonospora gifhornensis]|uniref:transposase n=1 Tax=Micromonospora gifhornensis TaxID=84594 RepID=UPI003451875F
MPVVRREELTDQAWTVIAPLPPEADGARGGGGIIVRSSTESCGSQGTGAPWRGLPKRFGPWQTCHEWLRRWTADGTWNRIPAAAQVHDDGTPVQWTISVDSSIVRAHQHARWRPQKRGAPRPPPFPVPDAVVQAPDGQIQGGDHVPDVLVSGVGRPQPHRLTLRAPGPDEHLRPSTHRPPPPTETVGRQPARSVLRTDGLHDQRSKTGH